MEGLIDREDGMAVTMILPQCAETPRSGLYPRDLACLSKKSKPPRTGLVDCCSGLSLTISQNPRFLKGGRLGPVGTSPAFNASNGCSEMVPAFGTGQGDQGV
jgi:hypothetical protein